MTKRNFVCHTSIPGVVLKNLVPGEAEILFALIDTNRAHLSQFDDDTSAKYPDHQSVLASITNPQNPAKLRLGIWYYGKLAGQINLAPCDNGMHEVGYWIASEYCGRGLATTAVKAILEYAKLHPEIKRLVGRTHLENAASQNVLLKAGLDRVYTHETLVWFAVDTKT